MSAIAHTQQNPEDAFVTRMLIWAMLWHDPNYDATPLWKDVKLSTLGSEIIWNKLFTDYEIPDIKHTHIPCCYSDAMITSPPHLWENHRAKFKNITVRIFERKRPYTKF